MDLRTIQHERVRLLLASFPGFRPVMWGEHSLDLLNMLNQMGRSGLLIVRGEDASERALAFECGDITWAASTEPSEGDRIEDVVYGLVALQAGAFTFLRGPEGSLAGGERQPTHHLLLDSLRRLDEARREKPGTLNA